MAKIINLRTVRKQKNRAKATACTSPAGLKKSERIRVARINTRLSKTLDGHKREDN